MSRPDAAASEVALSTSSHDSRAPSVSAAERLGWLAALVALFVGTYYGAAALVGGATTAGPALPPDRAIPFAPWAVFVYASAYTAPTVPLTLVDERAHFRRVALALAWVIGLSAIGFVAWPIDTGSLRPADLPSQGFTVWAAGRFFALDPGTNALPSLHAATATVVARLLSRGGPGPASIGWIWLGTLLASALLMRQHFVLDLVAGVALGLAVARVVIEPESIPREATHPRRALASWAALHGTLIVGALLVHRALEGSTVAP